MTAETDGAGPSLAETIAGRLRRDIVRGRLRPGVRLPRRDELARRYAASVVTVQAAVDYLVKEGFVVVGARKHGSFVAERPPHLHHYKLLFPYDPSYRGEFWRVLRLAARGLSDGTDREFSFFYGLGGHRDIESYRELVDEVRDERVAGLIFASGAAEFAGTPILDQPGIPRVAIANSYELAGIPKLHTDYAGFFDRALDTLLAQGRRRIAVLFGASGDGTAAGSETAVAGMSGSILGEFNGCMAARGLSPNPLWTQFCHIWSSLSARHCLQLMLHAGQRERPDGLILADDNFIPAATQGIVDAGVRVPDDLSVVALANFPVGIRAAVPVTRFGFDCKAMLATLAGWVDLLRSGQQPPDFAKAQTISEDEYLAP